MFLSLELFGVRNFSRVYAYILFEKIWYHCGTIFQIDPPVRAVHLAWTWLKASFSVKNISQRKKTALKMIEKLLSLI